MKKMILSCIILALLCASGCADFGIYIKDRGNDLADCFTARVGLSYGLGVRAQCSDYIGGTVGLYYAEPQDGCFGRAILDSAKRYDDNTVKIGVPFNQIFAPLIGIITLLVTPPPGDERYRPWALETFYSLVSTETELFINYHFWALIYFHRGWGLQHLFCVKSFL